MNRIVDSIIIDFGLQEIPTISLVRVAAPYVELIQSPDNTSTQEIRITYPDR